MKSLKSFINEEKKYVKWPFHFGVKYGSKVVDVDVNELTHNAQNPEMILYLLNGEHHRLQFDLNDEDFDEVDNFIETNFGQSMKNSRLSTGRRGRLQ